MPAGRNTFLENLAKTQREAYSPERITRPVQLVAGIVLLAAVGGCGFLGTALLWKGPEWVALILVFAAIAYFPLVCLGAYRLMTRFRGELLDGPLFLEFLEIRRRIIRDANLIRSKFDLEGVDLNEFLLEDGPQISVATRLELKEKAERIGEALSGISSVRKGQVLPIPGSVYLEVARALLVQNRWSEAAGYLDLYLREVPDDWEGQRARGVAYANSRTGRVGDLRALRSLNEAISLAPTDIDPDRLGRMYIYRGAMLRRLGRLDEAESSLTLAGELVTGEFETRDLKYNLAAVFSLRGDKERALDLIVQLRGFPREMSLVKRHLDDNFAVIKDDLSELLPEIKKGSC